jgi:ribonuclease G
LKRLVQSIKPKGFGVIVRTVAEGKNTAELERFAEPAPDGLQCVKLPTAHHPSKVLGELRASSILRDVFNDTFSGIQIDDEELYNQTKDYLQEIAPSKQSIVKFYQSKDTPILRNTT